MTPHHDTMAPNTVLARDFCGWFQPRRAVRVDQANLVLPNVLSALQPSNGPVETLLAPSMRNLSGGLQLTALVVCKRKGDAMQAEDKSDRSAEQTCRTRYEIDWVLHVMWRTKSLEEPTGTGTFDNPSRPL